MNDWLVWAFIVGWAVLWYCLGRKDQARQDADR